MSPDNPTLDRLEDQIAWYDKKSVKNQKWFKRLKVATIVTAAIIPFASGIWLTYNTEIWSPAFFIGGLGLAIVIIEGLQGLNQYQHNWTTYRSTCEDLKHEKYLWLAKAGPYAKADNADVLLAERVESLISREHTKWVLAQEKIEIKPESS